MGGVAFTKAFISRIFSDVSREIRLDADYSKMDFSMMNSGSPLACCLSEERRLDPDILLLRLS